ncbi:carboxylesterase family protein [Nocardia sp. R6R-6]|uniref:carboxylesterase family protein n=1 Tax=Nocardia sp. R6R-6 TaxID=3459303 RepID=UPI00403D7748
MQLSTTSGVVEGEVIDGVARFRGVRYGRLAGGGRFDPVAPATRDSVQDRRQLTAVFPQLPGRLGAVMGRALEEHPQSEDAFLLQIWAPVGRSGLPVLVFLHGGAFVTGGSGVRWYDGHRLARDGDMIVITVNYRLGPQADLVSASNDNPNRAVGDLQEALRWIRANVESFGGDPDEITLGGQSAGGFYSTLLGVLPTSRDGFKRLLLMSSPGIAPAPRDVTEELSAEVIAGLDGASPETAPMAQLLASHQQAILRRKVFGEVTVGLMPTIDGAVPSWLADPHAVAAELRVTDVLVTVTRDETGSFFFAAPERHVTPEQLRQLPTGTASNPDPYLALVEATSAELFGNHARRLAEAASARRIRTQLRQFTVPSPLAGVGSGHCFDLPFLFGNRPAWHDAPMLNGFDPDLFEQESAELRASVIDLVHGRLAVTP